MRKKDKRFGQFIFDNHNYDGNIDNFFKETASAIGSIVHCFNSLDGMLNSAICELINDRSDEPGSIVIYRLPFSTKIDLFNRLATSMQLSCKGQFTSLNKLVNDLKQCTIFRNAVIHAEWDSVDEDGYTYVKMHFDRNGMKQQYWQFTPESLEKIDEFIHQTFLLFDEYYLEKEQLLMN